MAKLFVLAPVYNEGRGLEAFVQEWIPVLRAVTDGDFTFCLLNDGSQDDSLRILMSLAKNYPELRVVNKPNTGHGSTCLLGYRMAVKAKADWVFQIDSDGQCDPSHFEKFWQSKDDGNVHYGCRRREDGVHRQVISKILALLLFFLSFRWVRDPNVPYRLLHRDVLQAALKRIPDNFRLVQVLLASLNDLSPGISWHVVRFRKRQGQDKPFNFIFFLREAFMFIRDYVFWLWRDGNPGPAEKTVKIGTLLISLLATYYLMVFFILALLRIPAFVEYNWLEGLHLLQVHRILTNEPLYPMPSLEFVPLIYGPLYFFISAAAAFISGESYTTLRLVSLISTLGTLVLIAMLVRSMTGSKKAACLAAGLYASMYGVVGFCFDIARIDSLFIFFTMLFVFCIHLVSRKGYSVMIMVVLSATCAVLTKQTALVPVLVLCVWTFTLQNRKAWITGILSLAAVTLSQVIPIIVTKGWYFYYLYKVPSSHSISMDLVFQFLKTELLQYLSIGLLLSFCAFFIMYKHRNVKRESIFYLLFLLSMIFISFAPRFKVGGDVNNFMPIAASFAVGCGLILGNMNLLKTRSSMLFVSLVLILNLQVFYWPTKALPSPEALERMRNRLILYQSLKEPIFSPGHAYLPIMAGKNESAFWSSFIDVWQTPGEISEALKNDLKRSIHEQRFKSIVIREGGYIRSRFPYALLSEYYRRVDIADILTQEKAANIGLTLYVPREQGVDKFRQR